MGHLHVLTRCHPPLPRHHGEDLGLHLLTGPPRHQSRAGEKGEKGENEVADESDECVTPRFPLNHVRGDAHCTHCNLHIRDEDEDDEEDDTAELLRELEKIKRERAEEKERQEREQSASVQAQREVEIATANPLLNLAAALGQSPNGVNTTKPGTFAVKRRWDDGTSLSSSTSPPAPRCIAALGSLKSGTGAEPAVR